MERLVQDGIRSSIVKDFQIKKFCAYGFLKNLKFFEPYLIIFLMGNNLSLTQIGFLVAIREVFINLFEIPSGILADYFGKKKELCFCFIFYIISFIFFFFSYNFIKALFGMVFFGMGEAFRSGTHKAMIYAYLDKKNWQDQKTFVYGRTRSFSLLGSAISSAFSIAIILSVPKDNFIFLASTIPYILDLILIASYPKFLDTAHKNSKNSFKEMFPLLLTQIKQGKKLRKALLQEGLTESSIAYAKDLFQPILEAIIIGSGVLMFSRISRDSNLKIMLGIVYAILNILASISSKKAYLLREKWSAPKCLFIFHISFLASFALLALFSKQYLIVCIVYASLYVLHSMRKPVFIDEIENLIDKSSRASFLSISSQLKSFFLMLIAPSLGFVYDNFELQPALFILMLLFVVFLPISLARE